MGNTNSNTNKGNSSSAYVTKSQLRVLKEKRQKIRHQPDNAISKKDDDTEKPVAPTRNRRMSTVSSTTSSGGTLARQQQRQPPPPPPPPADLATLLVQVERPEDAAEGEGRTSVVGRFRKHLESQDREAVLDFAIACNILRLKEADIKALMLKDPSNERIVAEAEEMLELLMTVGQVFILDGCVAPVDLEDRSLKGSLRDVLESLEQTTSEEDCGAAAELITRAFGLVWQARCDPRVWKRLQDEYSAWRVDASTARGL